MNVYLDPKRGSVYIAHVFIGAEPNEIDEGPYRGTVMMSKKQDLGLQPMQNLPPDQRSVAQAYKDLKEGMAPGQWQEADQRHLLGAFQDNRVVPYEGVEVSDMATKHHGLILRILESFLAYLPEPALKQRLMLIRSHIAKPYFSWIGGFRDADVFYYRIQSPLVAVEFDHHSGVFLDNKEPQRFHIHTLARAPNGSDYGNALREAAARPE